MKKLIALVLTIIVLCCSLTACNNTHNTFVVMGEIASVDIYERKGGR